MNTVDALSRLAAFDLPGASDQPIDIDSPEELLAQADSQHVLPWVAGAVDAGLYPAATDDWKRRLRERHLRAVQSALGTHAAAASAITRLAEAGVTDVRVLKGCATGPLDYERPTDRFSSDVDLLIQPSDLPAVLDAFPDRVVAAARRERWQQAYGKATTVHDDHRTEIDIHTLLGQGYFGLAIPLDELMETSDTYAIGGVSMLALDGPNRLIHTSLHVAASDYTGMHSRRDVLQLVLTSGVDWTEAIDRAARWKIDSLIARGIVEAWSTFVVGGHPLLEWARRHEPNGRQLLALALAGDRVGGHLLTAPLALPPHRWPGYVLPLMFPSRAYLGERGGGWSGRARSVWRSLRPG